MMYTVPDQQTPIPCPRMCWLWVPVYWRAWRSQELRRDLGRDTRSLGPWKNGREVAWCHSWWRAAAEVRAHPAVGLSTVPAAACQQGRVVLRGSLAKLRFSPPLSQVCQFQNGEILSFPVFLSGRFSTQCVSSFQTLLWCPSLPLYV